MMYRSIIPPFSAFLLGLGALCRLSAADFTGQEAAGARLQAANPGVKATVEAATGRRWVRSLSGALTSADGKTSGGAQLANLNQFQATDPDRLVKAFISDHADYFGHDAQALTEARRGGDSLSPSGLRTVTWDQRSAGIPVDGGRVVAGFAKNGGLMSLSDTFHSGVPATAPALRLTAVEAMDRIATQRGALAGAGVTTPAEAGDASQRQILIAPSASGDVHVFLTWFVANGASHLCWRISWTADDRLTYATYVDAVTGNIVHQQKLTLDACKLEHTCCPDAAHDAHEHHHEQPAAHPKADRLATASWAPQRRATEATLATPSLLLPWITPPSAPAAPNTPSAPQAALAILPFSMKVFAFPHESPLPQLPLTGTTPTPVAQSFVTNAIVDATASPNGWIDTTYTKGNNVDAYLDLTDTSNANNSTRAQGTGTPLTFDFTIDLALAPSDATYRKGAVVNTFYWSNWFHDQAYRLGFDEASRNFQVSNFGKGGVGNDQVNAEVQDGGGTNNANFSPNVDGIPGKMQMFVWTGPTPDRDGDLDATVIIHELVHGMSNRLAGGGDISLVGAQAGGMGEGWSDFYAVAMLSQPGDPVNGAYTVGSYVTNNYTRGIRSVPYSTDTSKNNLLLGGIQGLTAVHAIGTYWATFLWEVRCALVTKYGFDPGNRIALQLVTDGLKLTPSFPTIIEARDAILLADLSTNDGVNLRAIWDAFSKRGLGPGAVVPTDGSTGTITQDTTRVGDLLISVDGSLVNKRVDFVGPVGGPFAPSSHTVMINNLSAGTMTWSIASTPTWLQISRASGSIASSGTASLTFTVNASANSLSFGHSEATVTINAGSLGSFDLPVTLDVCNPYVVSTATYAWRDPASHTNITLADDAVSAARPLGFNFTYYGRTVSQVYIGSNGLLGFTSNGLLTPFNQRLRVADNVNDMICAWWADLYPPRSGASVTMGVEGTSPNRVAVISWNAMPNVKALTSPFTFQVLLHETSNKIVMQYKEVQTGLGTYGAGRDATIGIEHRSGYAATQYSYKGSTLLSNNLTLSFDTTPEMQVERSGAVIADGGTDAITPSAPGVANVLTYAVRNLGGAPLTLSGAPAFTVGGLSNCTATVTTQPASSIAATSTASMIVSVTPTAAGPWSFTLSAANNDSDENPYNWTVSGNAVLVTGPEMDVARGANAVADNSTDAVVGTTAGSPTTLTYVISNPGNQPLLLTNTPPFAVSGQANCTVSITTQPAASIASLGSSSLVVSVTPTAAGAWSFVLSAANNDSNENPYNWTVSGTAIAAGSTLASASYIVRGPVPAGAVAVLYTDASGPHTATITGSGANRIWSATVTWATTTLTVSYKAADNSLKTRTFTITRP